MTIDHWCIGYCLLVWSIGIWLLVIVFQDVDRTRAINDLLTERGICEPYPGKGGGHRHALRDNTPERSGQGSAFPPFRHAHERFEPLKCYAAEVKGLFNALHIDISIPVLLSEKPDVMPVD